ncbi:MAG: hypothetical protein M3Y17_12265 [Actinomycetota bacterium]|nr:hypothetical protein [Actinomycetota bacterium]
MLGERGEARTTALGGDAGAAQGGPRRPRVDGVELAMLAAFAVISVWVLGLDLWQVVVHGRTWTGTDGIYLVDQMQYLSWIHDAARHLLASNLFVLRSTPADYFQPAVVISGAISALGVAPWLSLLLWKPVAVGGAFYAVRQYVHRSLSWRDGRRAALALGLFFGSFTVVYGSFGVVGDLFIGFLSWGYTFGLVALATMLLALLQYDRARKARRLAWGPPLLGALASSMHPWQGELLALTLAGAELVAWRGVARRPGRRRGLGRRRALGSRGIAWRGPGWRGPGWRGRGSRAITWRGPGWLELRARLPLLALTVVATGVPLFYYAILGQADRSWTLAREASKHSFSLWTIALALAPLALPAAFAYRGAPKSFIALATRIWPLAALGVFLVSASGVAATPLHAFEGVTIPLAVLAVQGVSRAASGISWPIRFHLHRSRRRLLGWLVLAAATLPATVYELHSARALVAPSAGNASFITADERRALAYLDHDRMPGGVITRFYLGSVVPAQTGRRTFVGDCLWSEPDCGGRAKMAQKLLDGTLTPSAARALVLGSGARFVLSDCESRADLGRPLAPIVRSTRHFGCATVYEVD